MGVHQGVYTKPLGMHRDVNIANVCMNYLCLHFMSGIALKWLSRLEILIRISNGCGLCL